MRKIIFSLVLLAIILCPSIALGDSAAANDLQLECKSALLMDGISGDILYEQNSQEICYPASVTKIMTLVLILEAVDAGTISLDDMVPVSEEAASMGGSQVYLYPGEQRSVDEMLIAIAVGSGNDAAYAMAEYIGGTMPGFVELMNQRAQELGMNNTHFVNPHGLHDDDHYTTAHDLGILSYHALSVPRFLDYTSIYEYEFRPEPKLLTLWNTNRLLKWYEGTDGMKTGYTEEAGRNLVATVERDGMRLISVVLGAQERQGHFNESMKLLNYGFNQFTYIPIRESKEIICEAPVSKGSQDSVALLSQKAIGYCSPKGHSDDISEQIIINSTLAAPLQAGEIVGKLVIYKDGTEFKTIDLIVAEDVAKGGFLRTWSKLLSAI